MERAKQAIKDFVPTGHNHQTTIDQDVRSAVTEEQVRPHRHENVTTALDKEIHQDHHHTVVQPIKHTETLPEQHVHNAAPVEHREFHHGNDRDVKATLERDAAKFKDTSVTHKTTHSSSTAPVAAGERTYHHVHEHVQPVIQKETIQPQVVHTTVPIHETHHAASLHHGTSTLPTTTLEEFTKNGGNLEGRGVKGLKEFEGCPETYKENLQDQHRSGDHHSHSAGAVPVPGRTTDLTENSRGLNHQENVRDSGVSVGTTGPGTDTDAESKAFFSGGPGKQTSLASDHSGSRHTTSNTVTTDTTQQRKPSLMDKLDPRKDADGDGKKGFLS